MAICKLKRNFFFLMSISDSIRNFSKKRFPKGTVILGNPPKPEDWLSPRNLSKNCLQKGPHPSKPRNLATCSHPYDLHTHHSPLTNTIPSTSKLLQSPTFLKVMSLLAHSPLTSLIPRISCLKRQKMIFKRYLQTL